MSTPLTRAMTGSGPAAGASEEVSFEHPAATGRTSSSAARVANAIGRRRGIGRGSRAGEVMMWSWVGRASERAGQLGKTAPLGNHLRADFDDNVSEFMAD